MQRALIAAVAMATIVAAPAAATATPVPSPVTAGAAQDPMSGRWSHEALEASVSGPIATAESGNLARGEQEFERLLADAGDYPEERCRLLTAFAVGLMTLFEPGAEPVKYMRRAVLEARKAFPAESRMLAMALADYGILELETGGRASPEGEAALVEALGIRMRLLGPYHIETLVASTSLGQIRGAPERTGRSPAKVMEASRFFAPLLGAEPLENPEDSIDYLYLQWTEMLIDNRRPDMACKVLEALPEVDRRLRLNLDHIGFSVGLQLQAAGFERQAAPLVKEGVGAETLFGDLLGLQTSPDGTGPPPRCGAA